VALLASWFYSGNASQIRRNIFRLEGFHIHCDKTDKGAAVIGPPAAAAIDDDSDADDLPAVSAHNVNCFLDPSAPRNDILCDDEPFVRPDLKTASQDEASGIFFDEDVAFSERAAYFLADNNSTKGRGDDGVAVYRTQLVGESCANFSGDVGVLEEKGTLEKLPAMKSRPQDEMTVEERAGFPEEREQVLAHLGSARASRAGEGALAFANFTWEFRRRRRNEHARAGALPRNTENS
jgi:hypothetical protein